MVMNNDIPTQQSFNAESMRSIVKEKDLTVPLHIITEIKNAALEGRSSRLISVGNIYYEVKEINRVCDLLKWRGFELDKAEFLANGGGTVSWKI